MKYVKWLLPGLLGLLILAGIGILIFLWGFNRTASKQLAQLGPEATTLTEIDAEA